MARAGAAGADRRARRAGQSLLTSHPPPSPFLLSLHPCPFCFLPSTSVLSVSDLPSPAFRAPAMPEQLGEVLRPVPQVLERRKKRGVPAGGLLAHSRVRGSSFHCGWPYSFFTFQDWPEHTVWLAAQAACVAPCVPALILTLAHCGLVATWTASAAIQGLGRRSGLFRNIPGPPYTAAETKSDQTKTWDQSWLWGRLSISLAPPSLTAGFEALKHLLGAWLTALSRPMEFSGFPCSFSLSSVQVWGCGHGQVKTAGLGLNVFALRL